MGEQVILIIDVSLHVNVVCRNCSLLARDLEYANEEVATAHSSKIERTAPWIAGSFISNQNDPN